MQSEDEKGKKISEDEKSKKISEEGKGKRSISFKEQIKSLLIKNKSNTDIDIDRNKTLLHRRIFIILCACHISAFVQACGYFIQNTAFPYLTKSLGVNPQMYGYIISVTAFLQLLGGPICGRLGDIYGGRLTLIVSFLSIAVGYFIIAISTNIPMLFLSRLPIFGAHALQSMYMILSDITYEEDRADMIGKIGVSHGLGMIVGSGVGGFITDKFGKRVPFIVAVFVTASCVLITLAMIPKDTKCFRKILDESETESLEEIKDKNDSENKKDSNSFLGLKEITEVAKLKHMGYLLIVKIVSAFPFSVLSAMFTLLIMDYFLLGPQQNGIVLSYLGVVGMITQGYLVGLLTRHVSDYNLIMLATIIMTVGFLFLVISQNIYLFCLVAVPLTIGGSLIHIVITSLITKVVPNKQNGSALGLTLCTHAVTRSIAPTIGGFLFTRIGFFSFGVLGYLVNMCLTLYLCFYGRTEFD